MNAIILSTRQVPQRQQSTSRFGVDSIVDGIEEVVIKVSCCIPDTETSETLFKDEIALGSYTFIGVSIRYSEQIS